jgi:hypothetical protein
VTGRHPELRPELERVARPGDARVTAPDPAAQLARPAPRLPAFRLTRRALGRAA